MLKKLIIGSIVLVSIAVTNGCSGVAPSTDSFLEAPETHDPDARMVFCLKEFRHCDRNCDCPTSGSIKNCLRLFPNYRTDLTLKERKRAVCEGPGATMTSYPACAWTTHPEIAGNFPAIVVA